MLCLVNKVQNITKMPATNLTLVTPIAIPICELKILCFVENVIQIMYGCGMYSFPGNYSFGVRLLCLNRNRSVYP